ncbi:MAG: J domain-containing protein [Kiritimatiellaeota bacterium]|nr:J domain-containing protein [Kiritimatiellota bacterium]
MTMETHYDILGITRDCDFKALKKAYFQRAKKCHPDRFGGAKEKELEFKRLVRSFDIISDPLKRREYDSSLGLLDADGNPIIPVTRGFSVMDSPADDILEELIVGNTPPEDATLATLLRDLERTEVFITFREGKTCYYDRKLGKAMSLLRRAVSTTQHNILYRFYLARVCVASGNHSTAIKHYKRAIAIGNTRIPQQRLLRIHSELDTVRKKKSPWWFGLTALFSSDIDENLFVETEEAMIDEANRAIARIMADDTRKSRKELT